jgi:DUF177 domain-containing protein
MLNETAGYVRVMDFAEDKLNIGPDLHVTDFGGQIQLGRTPQGVVVQGQFTAQLPAECVRCLKPCSQLVRTKLQDLFIYPPSNSSDPLLTIGEDAILDLEPLLREYMLLDLPMRPLCRPDCQGLCPVCGTDLNVSECGHDRQTAPPAPSIRIISSAQPPEA